MSKTHQFNSPVEIPPDSIYYSPELGRYIEVTGCDRARQHGIVAPIYKITYIDADMKELREAARSI
jgi:hypothetical protein